MNPYRTGGTDKRSMRGGHTTRSRLGSGKIHEFVRTKPVRVERRQPLTRRARTRIVVCHGFALCLTLSVSHHVSAAKVVVTHLDGTTQAGSFEGIAESGFAIRADGSTARIAIDEITRVEFPNSQPVMERRNACTFYLDAGGQLGGDLIAGTKDAIVARTRLADRTELHFESLAAIEFHSTGSSDGARLLFEAAFAERLAGKDVLITAGPGQAKSLRGTLVELGLDRGEFIFNGKPRRIRTSRIHAIVFAAGIDRQRNDEVVAHLASGDVVSGSLGESTDRVIRMNATFGQAVELPVDALRSLEIHSHRVVYLSDLEPTVQKFTGIVQHGWPSRNDRNAFNQPIVLGGKAYAKGLGVHARSKLVYRIDGQFETFAATIGIDDAVRPAGHVEFIVSADGRRIFESGAVTGVDVPRDVRVSVVGVERLTLLVDFGANADVGDWADWASARLIKRKKSDY